MPLAEHRVELALTLLQSLLGLVLLANFSFQAYEALGLFALWFAQFLVPHWREEICVIYGAWLAVELITTPWRPGRLAVFREFPRLWTRAGGGARTRV